MTVEENMREIAEAIRRERKEMDQESQREQRERDQAAAWDYLERRSKDIRCPSYMRMAINLVLAWCQENPDNGVVG